MGDIIYLSRQRIQITVYVRGERRNGPHPADCEMTTAIVQGLVEELGKGYFELRSRTWPGHLLEAVVHGGWRSPVVMVGHVVVSEHAVPDRAQLRAYLKEQVHLLRPRLAKSG